MECETISKVTGWGGLNVRSWFITSVDQSLYIYIYIYIPSGKLT